MSYDLYNLFESELPATGHLALTVATTLSSMTVDERRQVNFAFGAVPSEGKTEVLKKFAVLERLPGGQPFINFFTRATFAHYVLNYCGKYLDPSKPVGQELPAGCIREKGPNGRTIISTAHCEDYITNSFDLVHAGEGIFTIGDVGSLMQLWNGLLDEGFWEGGNRWIGHYKIGSPIAPKKHGLILACTMSDLENKWIKSAGTLSRTITGAYYCNTPENQYIVEGRTPPNVHITYRDFSGTVYGLLTHIDPYLQKKVTFGGEVNSENTTNILELIKIGRDEITGKRAMNDRITLLKAHAALNKRNKVILEDVVFCESMLQMCRRIKISRKDNSDSARSYYYGDRLHFQVRLRQLLGFTEDEILKQMSNTFKMWDSSTPVYSEKHIKDTINSLALPIQKLVL